MCRIGTGEFRLHRLTNDHRPRRPQGGHRGAIALGLISCLQLRSVFGGHISGIQDILDAHRHAVEEAPRRLVIAGVGLGRI